jgi:hypothetical protein
MADLTASTTYESQAAQEEFLETTDLVLLAENAGTEAARELHYPEDLLPAIIYDDFPDKCENFDSEPLAARPSLKTELTIGGTKMARWPGYVADKPVKEIWSGDATKSRMTLAFLRRLAEFYLNPPDTGYIVWKPKDRTTKSYYIEIESLTVAGADTIQLDYYGSRLGLVMGEVALTFRIVSEVPA